MTSVLSVAAIAIILVGLWWLHQDRKRMTAEEVDGIWYVKTNYGVYAEQHGRWVQHTYSRSVEWYVQYMNTETGEFLGENDRARAHAFVEHLKTVQKNRAKAAPPVVALEVEFSASPRHPQSRVCDDVLTPPHLQLSPPSKPKRLR